MIPRLLGRASAKLQQRRTLAVIGGGSLALAVGVAFLPWLFPAAVFRPLSTVLASPASIFVVAGAAGLLGMQALRASATPASDDENDRLAEWAPAREPERAYFEEHRTTGEQIDSVFNANREDTRKFSSRRRTAQNRIRETAIAVVADAERIDEERAAERISAGSWTDDPRAAAFLGGRHLAPLRTRIRDWASGERFERWATHAVEAIDAIDQGETANGGESSEASRFDGGPHRFDSELDDLADDTDNLAGESERFARETERDREVAR
ncbi:DUF7269 family protein [Halorussus pelagicus]|uniref:DUF7269 family protein n=1 Tax=Halorussus pelagicus TaxID=2505977 RepID=UPI000FFC7036|nr:hypothetical protein [Halorussus pelagicus]